MATAEQLQSLPSLEGKAVVLSGGTTGIGRATAHLLLEAGSRVLIYGRDQQALDEALSELEPKGEVHGMSADQANPDDVRKVFAKADEVLGGVDILINNAAIGAKSVTDMSEEEWRYAVEANLLGYIACCFQAVKRMEQRGAGHIVNVGSMSVTVREKGSDVYVATKAGIEGFSEALRKRVNEMGIKVSLIEPGSVATDMSVRDQGVRSGEEIQQAHESGEMLMSEDIARCIHFVLTQPARSNVVEVKVRPHRQEI
jgi:NADP-dependent 3-hydroxy acid dehydrogenase YdfG